VPVLLCSRPVVFMVQLLIHIAWGPAPNSAVLAMRFKHKALVRRFTSVSAAPPAVPVVPAVPAEDAVLALMWLARCDPSEANAGQLQGSMVALCCMQAVCRPSVLLPRLQREPGVYDGMQAAA